MGNCSSGRTAITPSASKSPTALVRSQPDTFAKNPIKLDSSKTDGERILRGVSSGKLFTDIKIESSIESDIYLKDVHTPLDSPCISGCALIPDGQVILCDNWHNRLLLLDSSFTIKDTLDLQAWDGDDAWPYDVSMMDNSTALVTLPELMKVMCVEVAPTLKLGRELVNFQRECYGIHVDGKEIFVTLHNNPGDGEILVVDMEGKLLRAIGINQNDSLRLQRPYHITVSSRSRKIYVTDSTTGRVICMSPDGSVVYIYEDKGLERPKGICADAEDNIMVCGNSSHNIQVVTSSGKLVHSLLTSKDGLEGPYSVVYREKDNALIVGCRRKKLPVFYV